MEIDLKKNVIKVDKELSELDLLVLKFTEILQSMKIDYVIVSGYVAILFGRSRQTEDIDLFVEEISFEKFLGFWKKLEEEGFECINESNPGNAFNDYLEEKLALRFAEKGTLQPNFELKIPKTDLNYYSLKNKVVVELNGKKLNTSKIELQIAFKLYLGSEKDLEDAIHLWEIFKSKLYMPLFAGFAKRLNVESKIKLLE